MLLALIYIALTPTPSDSVAVMDSVHMFSHPHYMAHNGSRVVQLNEGNTLNERLSFSPYFTKNYGPSGISTLGLRGTQASQTQIIWHGIPLNNPMLGETDLQTLTLNPADHLSINQSGNSSVYGSGAVGGSLIIHNEPTFNEDGYKQELDLSMGNFGYSRFLGQSTYSTKKMNLSFGLNKSRSTNNYQVFIDEQKKELKHAELNRLNLNILAAFKLKNKSQIKTILEWNTTNRNLPNFFTNVGTDKLEIKSLRWMTEGLFNHEKISHGFNVGYIHEDYLFISQANPEGSKSNSDLLVAKYWGKKQFYKVFRLDLITEMQYQSGTTQSYSSTQEQILPSTVLSLNYEKKGLIIGTQNRFDFKASKRISKLYFDYSYKNLRVYSNIGNAFRRPTLNQLYWGSPIARNLQVEEGIFGEIGGAIAIKKLTVDVSLYSRALSNEIIWVPDGNSSKAINLNRTRALGHSSNLNYRFRIKTTPITLMGQYEFVQAETLIKESDEWENTLFIPKHSYLIGLKTTLKNITIGIRNRFTSYRYTNYDSDDYAEGFFLWSGYINYTHKDLSVRLTTNNALNTRYYIQPAQQMPMRQYQLGLNLTI